MPEGEALGVEQRLGLGSAEAGPESRRHRDRVDRTAAQGGQIECDEAPEGSTLGLDATDDAGAAAERDHGYAGGRAGFEHGGDVLAVRRRQDRVGSRLDGAAAHPDQVRIALPGGVADPILVVDADGVLAAGGRDHGGGDRLGKRDPHRIERDAGERLGLPELGAKHRLGGGAEPLAGVGRAPAVVGGVAPEQLPGRGHLPDSPLALRSHRQLDPVEGLLEGATGCAPHQQRA